MDDDKSARALELEPGACYEAPLCSDDIEIGVGEFAAILQFKTVEGATLQVAIPLEAVNELSELLREASKAAERLLGSGPTH